MKRNEMVAHHICPAWLSFMLDARFRRLVHKPEKIIGEYLHPGDTAIDIGCGSGYFTLPMAKIVGEHGRIIAVDMQEKMLAKVEHKAGRLGLKGRVSFHPCSADNLGVEAKADFILAFYMVHETPSPRRFFAEVKGLLAEKGKILIVEPPFHVSRKKFAGMIAELEESGLRILSTPSGKGGRSVLAAHI